MTSKQALEHIDEVYDIVRNSFGAGLMKKIMKKFFKKHIDEYEGLTDMEIHAIKTIHKLQLEIEDEDVFWDLCIAESAIRNVAYYQHRIDLLNELIY